MNQQQNQQVNKNGQNTNQIKVLTNFHKVIIGI